MNNQKPYTTFDISSEHNCFHLLMIKSWRKRSHKITIFVFCAINVDLASMRHAVFKNKGSSKNLNPNRLIG